MILSSFAPLISLSVLCFLIAVIFICGAKLFLWEFICRRNELARKVAKDFLLDLQSGTLDL